MRNLHLIQGSVKDLVVNKSYVDPVFSPSDKNAAGILTIGAVATGQAISSAVLANSSRGAEINVETFTCTVSGFPIYGFLHRVDFRDGDEMEFVIEKMGERGVVQGARSAARRLVWMLPYQTRGLVAQQKNNNKWRYITSLACGGATTAFFQLTSRNNSHEPIWLYPADFIGVFLIVLGISFIITRRFHEFSVMATEVLGAFGYENPASVDLPAISKAAERKWRKENTSPPHLFQPWRFRY